MPRKSAVTGLIKRKPRLNNPLQVNDEIRKTYTHMVNGEMSEISASRRMAVLIALRNGMEQTTENSIKDLEPATFNIFSVPENRFLSGEEIAAINEGRSIITPEECTPLQLENSAPSEQTNKVVELSPRELRNKHFRHGFKDPGDDDGDGGDGAA
jgi:hypothetical protein